MVSSSRINIVQMATTVPAELADAAWLPELKACCAVSDAAAGPDEDGAARMGTVLEWLQTMLVQLELGATKELDGEDAEEDELDEGFVKTARPWLHTEEFYDVQVADFPEQLWAHLNGADYLKPSAKGGAMLLLLPSRLPYSLFQQVTATVRDGVASHVNSEVTVSGYHPDSDQKAAQTPVPVIQVFLDSPDLLIDGGSMSDAASFL